MHSKLKTHQLYTKRINFTISTNSNNKQKALSGNCNKGAYSIEINHHTGPLPI